MSQPLRESRARDRSITVGTADYLIADIATFTYRTFFQALVDGAEYEYYVAGDTEDEFEIARGVWTVATRILTRAQIIRSTQPADAKVPWSLGDKTLGAIFGPPLMGLLGDGRTGSDVGPNDVAVSPWLGAIAQAYGRRDVTGDAQIINAPINILTTNNTFTEMRIGGTSITSSDNLNLVDNRLYAFDGLIGAWQHSGASGLVGDSAAYRFEGAIKQVAGTTSLVGTPTITVLGEDDAAWDVTITADDGNNRLSIKVKGAANKNIHWNGHLKLVEAG